MAWFDSPKNGISRLRLGAQPRFASIAAAALCFFSSSGFAAPDKATLLGYSARARVSTLTFVTIGDDHWCVATMKSSKQGESDAQTVSMVTKSGKNKVEIAPFPGSKEFIVGSKSKMTCEYLQQREAAEKAVSVFASASTVALPYLVQVLGDPLLVAWAKGSAANGELFKVIQELGAGVFHPIVSLN